MGACEKARFELAGSGLPEALIARCAAGIKMRRAGREAVRIVTGIGAPFDFDTVWAHVRRTDAKVSRAAVYLSLRRLRRAGLIRAAAQKPPLTQSQEVLRAAFLSR